MQRTASAVWKGSLREGSGTLNAPSGVLSDTPYSFLTRFENTPGTNPEELIAAAHAGCFSMALSAGLSKEGFTPTQIATSAKLTLENQGGWAITAIHLDVKASIPNIDTEKFQAIAADAKANCPVSKVLRANITMTATLG